MRKSLTLRYIVQQIIVVTSVSLSEPSRFASSFEYSTLYFHVVGFFFHVCRKQVTGFLISNCSDLFQSCIGECHLSYRVAPIVSPKSASRGKLETIVFVFNETQMGDSSTVERLLYLKIESENFSCVHRPQ